MVAATFLTPAVYETHAVVTVDGPKRVKRVDTKQAAARLKQAASNPAGADQEKAASEASRAFERARETMRIETADGRDFFITVRDSDSARVVETCDLLAREIANLAPQVLVEKVQGRTENSSEAMRSLAALLTAHPELASVSATPGASASAPADPAMQALLAERLRLRMEFARLSAKTTASHRENPYDDSLETDMTKLRRRLDEIRIAIGLREKAGKQQDGATAQLAPEVAKEWRELLTKLAREGEKTPPATPEGELTATVSHHAGPPGWPVRPNRPLWLLVGVLLAIAAGAGSFSWRARRTAARRVPEQRLRTVPLRPEAFGNASPLLSNPRPPQPSGGVVLAPPPSMSPSTQRLEVPSSRPSHTMRLGSLASAASLAQRGASEAEGLGSMSTTPPEHAVFGYVPTPSVSVAARVSSAWRPRIAVDPSEHEALRDDLTRQALTRCFIITISAGRAAAEDKTRVAIELALALSAVPHTRTLIIEGNLNRPRLHTALGVSVPVGTGLSNQLHHKAHGNTAPDWKVIDLGNGLHALTEGALRAPGLVLSTVFEKAIGDLRGYYDHIVIDGPFESELVEGRALSPLVDGVIRISPDSQGEGTGPLLSDPRS